MEYISGIIGGVEPHLEGEILGAHLHFGISSLDEMVRTVEAHTVTGYTGNRSQG